MKNISIQLNPDSEIPLYIQLYNTIRDLIEKGELKEEEKLSSIRVMAKKLDVNPVTVVNAYKLLEQNGYIYTKRGSGSFVKPVSKIMDMEYKNLDDENIQLMTSGILSLSENSINFASAVPTHEFFPVEDFKEVLIGVLDRDKGKAFVYPEINGYKPLRESISQFVSENYSIEVSSDQVQIISGAQQGIDIIGKALIRPGDYILCENPTYTGAIMAFKSRGAKMIGLPIYEDGIDISALEESIKEYHPRFLYIMPNYQSPTTYSYSEEKKKCLIEIAHENNLYIIEDDFLMDLNFEEEKLPLKSYDKYDLVLYIKSFSKILMPGLRIGFLIPPKKLFRNIMQAKHTTDISSSGFIQRAFDLYLRNNMWKKHIENIKKDYKERYEIMTSEVEKLEKYGVTFHRAGGGLSLWLKLPEDIPAAKLYHECAKNNVIIVPGEIFFIENTDDNNYIRLSFGSVGLDEIKKGMSIIQECIKSFKDDDDTKYVPFI